MRNTKTITILDDTDEIKFKLTAMAAMAQQRWLSKAGALLVKSGMLKANIGVNPDVGSIVKALLDSDLAFLGNIDTDGVNRLMVDLICQTACKLSGARGVVEMTENELENTFTKLSSLIELEKQCLTINFDFFHDVGVLTGPDSKMTSLGASKPSK